MKSILTSASSDSRRRVIESARHTLILFRALKCGLAFDCGLVQSLTQLTVQDTTTISLTSTPNLRIAQPIYNKHIYV